MNKAEASVIDLGTIRHGHRDGIFLIRRCTYCITDHCLAVSNVALSRTSLLLVPRIDTCWTFTLQTMNIYALFPLSERTTLKEETGAVLRHVFPPRLRIGLIMEVGGGVNGRPAFKAR